LLYALTSTANFGIRGGYESTSYVLQNKNQAIFGAELSWRPSERTDFFSLVERRFFGTGWQLRFTHRMARVAWNMAWTRDVVSSPQAFITLPPTNNVAALLDAALTTRYPDPTERSRAVADLIAREGIPTSLSTQTSLFAQRLGLTQGANASVVFVGVRNSLAFSGYRTKSEDLADSVFSSFIVGSANLKQTGGSVSLSHLLTPATSLTLVGSYVRAQGVGRDQGLNSKQNAVRLQVTHQLAPKSSMFAGARVQRFDSNVPGLSTSAHERAGFVGLSHRF
jgi:uncharacterized protein (PEP-CTERM system associated)